ncbi:YfiT family bacillithiol transferase [Adhaeribacter pallidiroseus]|uniref:Putative metal-dependent hydrolase n=1 Tax=Adhaeribacter pallidiroseus TaxID=2072847 RepID=A0A369QGX9_9BACT|nr:putative metal-dependent hydrolase [Adhaeribacter pallidiroseus]RDC62149.1 putative metal-dependent hydrolase [Adhaeribacter pallidiroseus]
MEHVQYPVGRFQPKPDYTPDEIVGLLQFLKNAPPRYEELITNLAETNLNKTYRPGAWTVRQLVHHVADIHLTNFLRLKKALTEENYEITIIRMDDWAALPDSTQEPIGSSLLIFKGVNERYVALFKTLDEQTLSKTYYHATRQLHLSLKQMLYMATWHVAHHLGHIRIALGREPEKFNLKS